MKAARVSDRDILYFYSIKIRSILEYACPVFNSMMTQEDCSRIERIQKIVFKVILREKYRNYSQAGIYLNTLTLKERRSKLCLNFALSCLKSDKFSQWFVPTPPSEYNLRTQEKFIMPFCRTERRKNSPIPYLDQN